MGVAASWLPPELSVSQPYSMGPLTSWAPPPWTHPAMGTVVRMDDRGTSGRWSPANEMMIKGMFVAPASIQREAQKAGEHALIMEHPRGLLEALGMVESEPLVNIGGGHGGLDVPPDAAQSFADALMALEDED